MHIDIGVAIPSRGPTLGLWATICSLEEAAKFSGKTIQYSICRNGVCSMTESDTNLLSWLGGEDRGVVTFDTDVWEGTTILKTIPPPVARNRSAKHLDSDYIFFVDDHVIVPHDWFLNMMFDSDAVVFSSYKTNQYQYYHFLYDPDLPTKGDYSREPLMMAPYQCLSGPNGGFGMKCSTWNKLGGYDTWYETFGGEETDLAFKAHKLGISVLMSPLAYYYHYSVRSKDRGYDKTIDQENYVKLYEALGKPYVPTKFHNFSLDKK